MFGFAFQTAIILSWVQLGVSEAELILSSLFCHTIRLRETFKCQQSNFEWNSELTRKLVSEL